MVMHPLAQVLIYALILSQIMRAKFQGVETSYAYPIYILSGMVAWTLFSELFGRLLGLYINNANMMKKINFPKSTLILISIGSSLVNFFILLLMMFLIFGFLGHTPFGAIFWLIPLITTVLLLGIGFGLILGIINVFIRDVGQIMNIVMQFWFWLTPIVYMTSIVPEKYQIIINLNPMSGVVVGFQNVLLYSRDPDLSLLIYPIVLGLLTTLVGIFLFKKTSSDMTDVL
jgi:lipopolysaccharide transport system permease protein